MFPSRDGLLRTAKPISGRYYDFALTAGTRLIITETDAEGTRLELLDLSDESGGAAGPVQSMEVDGTDGEQSAAAVAAWARDLPLRLRELHSHWLHRGSGGRDAASGYSTLLLRPHSFLQHDVQFVIKCSAPSSTASDGDGSGGERLYDCRRVPLHLQGKPWQQLVEGEFSQQLTHRLVHTACPGDDSGTMDQVVSVLAKFEDPAFIHVYQPAPAFSSDRSPHPCSKGSVPSSRLLYELPRYGLEFELSEVDGQLRSLQYKDAVLRCRQQMVEVDDVADGAAIQYTLPNFKRYLVLEVITAGSSGSGSMGSMGGDGGQVIEDQQSSEQARQSSLSDQVMVLVPVGEVVHVEDGATDVAVSSWSGAQLKVRGGQDGAS